MVVALNMWDDTRHKGVHIDLERLQEILGVPVTELMISMGKISKVETAGNENTPSIQVTEVISKAFEAREQLTGHGWYRVPHLEWNKEDGQGDSYVTYAFAANIAEVVVDTWTGEVTIERFTAAHDVGRAINPGQVRGQIEGGALQGIGYGLWEEIISDNGIIMNPGFSTYIIPTSMDAPEFDPIIVEHPFPGGPFGAKGFGEQPLMGAAPAVTSAIFHATGARVKEIPATPERILGLLKGKPGEYER
jgi:CO/xanthine dehydrogenase Mo-binding subunit